MSNNLQQNTDANKQPEPSTAKFAEIAKSIADGFQFGPRLNCACCQQANADQDSVGRGICATCWETIEIHILDREV